MAIVRVFMSTFGYRCAACGSMDYVYQFILGDLSFYLCEEHATSLYRSIEAEVIVPDQREW